MTLEERKFVSDRMVQRLYIVLGVVLLGLACYMGIHAMKVLVC